MEHPASCYMGIDIGTSGTKGVIIGPDCRIIAEHHVAHEIENPKPNYYEHDAENVWWKEFCEVSGELIRMAGIDSGAIVCVGASTLGADCLPVDESCRPLRKAILYGIDSRSQQQIEDLTGYYGEKRVKELFGRPICSGDVAAKILWLKQNEPEIYKRTYKFLTGSSFITARLTGNYVVDQFLAQASFRPLYHMDGRVNEEECRMFCRPDQIARAQPVHAAAGTVTARAGLRKGRLLSRGRAIRRRRRSARGS